MHAIKYTIPDVDVSSFGAFSYTRLIAKLWGYDLDRGQAATFAADIDRMLSDLKPIHRFVVEARMRGVTLRRTNELVGWSNYERSRQVEARAFRVLRESEMGKELHSKLSTC